MSDDMPQEIWCHPILGGNFAFTLMRKAVSKKDTRYIKAPTKPTHDSGGDLLNIKRSSLEKLDGYADEITQALTDKDAEIVRLREALEVIEANRTPAGLLLRVMRIKDIARKALKQTGDSND